VRDDALDGMESMQAPAETLPQDGSGGSLGG
jgi:hypothetical protein